MATTLKELFVGASTSITWTSLNSLANNGCGECLGIDNTTNLYDDSQVNLLLKMGAAVSTGDCFAFGSKSIDGTNYSDPAQGTDATRTITRLYEMGLLLPGDILPGTDLVFLGRIHCIGKAAAAIVNWGRAGLAKYFDGNLPQKYSFLLVNMTGQALAASGHTANYTGVEYQNV